jgi:hypothetical protein
LAEAGLTSARPGSGRKRRWILWVAGGVLLSIAALAGIAAIVLHNAEPFMRARIVAELQERFHARVELDGFHMSLAHGLSAEGRGLRIWPPAEVNGVAVPATNVGDPLISLGQFRFHAPLHYSAGKPFHISVVQLEGLDIHLPPRSHFGSLRQEEGNGATQNQKPADGNGLLRFSVGRIECKDAHLVLETDKPGKLPLDFAIARLKLDGVTSGGPMAFDAELTNPRPVGKIHTTGSFGPWRVDDPGESPIQGQYTFDHADLATFNGIAGILSSTGKYDGTLRNMTVDGETDTPDFRLTHFGNAMELHTHFHAKVDGTNGDTWLEPVDAMLGRSHFTARGQVVRVPLPQSAGTAGLATTGGHPTTGHDINLAVDVDRARIEDFLHLAGKTNTPVLTGAVRMKTTLHIPPGKQPVHQRMQIKGSFVLDGAEFTNRNVQDKIEQLSLRGQGRPKDVKTTDPGSVRSNMQGNFDLESGVLALPALSYQVPGALIELKGTYGEQGGELNFMGTAKLDATVSQMVGGLLGKLVKPADRFFKKDGVGTELPIHVSGTREAPEFGVDFGRMRKKPGDTKQ